MPPRIDSEKCSRCGLCVSICPMQVFRQAQPKTVPRVAWGDECWHCNACVLDCPSGALSLRIPLNYMVLHVDADSLRDS